MIRPKQAAILCGGLGTRMRPLTDLMPKPMVSVNGRPFLAYLVEQLRDQGIRRIVLLTGYLSEQIRDHFADGAKWDVDISYSHGPVEWGTGRRVWEARQQLDESFLLLYSDNFVPFNLDKLLAFHAPRQAAISLLVQAKTPGNISLAANGRVECYDPSRKGLGLDQVEIGYMLVERDLMLEMFDAPDVSFSHILTKLADCGRLAGFFSRDPYHSISDPARWWLAEQYLTLKRILLIDRDGTINQRPPPAEYVTSWQEFRWVDNTVAAMESLAGAGFRFIVLSNQAGIGRGRVDAKAVHAINKRMIEELGRRGIQILDVYICPHDWNENCGCRKPAPGMLLRASKEHLLRMDRTIFIGDDPRDALAAERVECLSVLVGPQESGNHPGAGAKPTFASETLLEAAPWIVACFERWSEQHPNDTL